MTPTRSQELSKRLQQLTPRLKAIVNKYSYRASKEDKDDLFQEAMLAAYTVEWNKEYNEEFDKLVQTAAKCAMIDKLRYKTMKKRDYRKTVTSGALSDILWNKDPSKSKHPTGCGHISSPFDRIASDIHTQEELTARKEMFVMSHNFVSDLIELLDDECLVLLNEMLHPRPMSDEECAELYQRKRDMDGNRSQQIIALNLGWSRAQVRNRFSIIREKAMQLAQSYGYDVI
jgi:DNA-directed RNA polymerase specialized sigma24 family protein